jgi:integrase-like protein
MSTVEALLEPTFVDAIGLIEGADELSPTTRTHWMCSLRQIAKALDKPLEVIPARYSAIKNHLRQLHHAPLGLTAKTLANHKSNAKAGLLWLTNEKSVPRHGTPLSADWERLHAQLSARQDRYRLASLMRFCSGQGIAPAAVDEIVVDGYYAYRSREMARSTHAVTRRVLARLWNAQIGVVEGWPCHRLIEPPVKARTELTWQDFPKGLRDEVEGYLTGLGQLRRSRSGQRLRPCKPATIACRRREILLAAKRAVGLGTPIESLSSLGKLLDPDVVEKILGSYWEQNGETPKTFTIDLACHLLAAARGTGCVSEEALARLDDLRATLELHRQSGLTDKNIALIRQVLTEGVWSRVVHLPAQLMAKARSRLDQAPVAAGVLAQIAVAIAILSVAPVRRSNLTNIRLDTNLIKPGGPQSNYWLVFPDYDVKNRVRLEFVLDDVLTALIDEYVHEFRPTMLRGRNEDWLFPGQRGGAKQSISFGTQIVNKIYKATGLRVTVHQFRHAAGALLLKKFPGNYELVRRVLGHRSIETTINSYCGLENIQASEIFGELVREQLNRPKKAEDD